MSDIEIDELLTYINRKVPADKRDLVNANFVRLIAAELSLENSENELNSNEDKLESFA